MLSTEVGSQEALDSALMLSILKVGSTAFMK